MEFKKYIPVTSLDKIDLLENNTPIGDVLKFDWNEGVIPPPDCVI
jgi:hypothetical protein